MADATPNHVEQPDPRRTYAYDVFISYSPQDRDWVNRELVPHFQAAQLRLITSDTFDLGAPQVSEFERAVLSSGKTLLVLTPDSLQDAWAGFAAIMVHTLDPASRERRFIPIIKEPCDLPLRFQGLVAFDATGVVDWERLVMAVRAPLPEPPSPAIPVLPSNHDVPTTSSGSSPLPLPRPLRVFLCHSSSDKPAVRELYQRLKVDGIDPWLDEKKLLPGQDWQLEITRAVRASDLVIVCLSQKSVTKVGFVQKEIKYALDVAEEQPEGSIFIIPLKLEECDVPERLRRWQWVNLFESDGYERLYLTLQVRADEINKHASSEGHEAVKTVLSQINALDESQSSQGGLQHSRLQLPNDFLITDASAIIDSPVKDIEQIFGTACTLTSRGIGSAEDIPDGGETRTYEVHKYIFGINFDKMGIAKGIHILEGLSDLGYTLDQWAIVLSKLGIAVTKAPDLATATIRKWNNYLGYVITVTAKESDANIHSVQVRKLSILDSTTEITTNIYQERMAVYNAFRNLIGYVLRTATLSYEELLKFSRAKEANPFLFGPDIVEYLQEVYVKGVDLCHVTEALKNRELPVGERRSQLSEQMRQLVLWFAEQDNIAKDKFSQYFSIDRLNQGNGGVLADTTSSPVQLESPPDIEQQDTIPVSSKNVLVIGHKLEPKVDCILWDDDEPNLTDYDVIIMDLTTKKKDVPPVEAYSVAHGYKYNLANYLPWTHLRQQIASLLLAGGTLFVIVDASSEILISDDAPRAIIERYNQKNLLPFSLYGKIVPGGKFIKLIDKKFDFYFRKLGTYNFVFSKRISSEIEEDAVFSIKLQSLAENRIGEALGISIQVDNIGSRILGKMYILPKLDGISSDEDIKQLISELDTLV